MGSTSWFTRFFSLVRYWLKDLESRTKNILAKRRLGPREQIQAELEGSSPKRKRLAPVRPQTIPRYIVFPRSIENLDGWRRLRQS
jgi:hypothetical protein